ncbi:protein TANC2 isoform X3 [Monomorium pharaonis]|uniref:protein TANC2 isoform X3 n=1 Tax=Monomorium pharaonis TaxID=307658 RepID=UPI001746B931|nr:protein TANC2 isoform X3 [Monomorium pharaonis]
MAPPNRSPRPTSGLSHSVIDLAQMRALIESTGILGEATCPSCDMPFDKGKKRRLIDSCGHERCYSCLFRNEVCPLCLRDYDFNDDNDNDELEEPPLRDVFSAPQSTFAFTDVWLDESSTNSLCSSPRLCTKVITKTQPPSRIIHQRGGEENLSLVAKNLKSKALALTGSSVSQDRQKLKMTQSCPTPPNQRKRFYLNPKVLKSSFAVQRSSRHLTSPEPITNNNSSALPVMMTSSLEERTKWPGVVLGKIKSLWNNSQGTVNNGLNQLIGSSNKVADEGGCVKSLSSKSKKSSQSDLYMRLGLLLGSNRANVSAESSMCPSRAPIQGHSSTVFFNSLTSFETQTMASTNTSPVSTLTGTSSEAEVAAALRCPIQPKIKAKEKTKSCDSTGSLASISTSLSASTSMSMSMSMSVSGLSNCSSSPFASRKHSCATLVGQTEFSHLKNKRTCARRSVKTGNIKSPFDAKLCYNQRYTAQLNLKPLFFEVPLLEEDPFFVGRQWLLHELESIINGSSPGTLISGSPGTGKTALILQLVEHSCFGRKRKHPRAAEVNKECDEREKQNTNTSLQTNVQHTNEKVCELASHVVAYHFCQADNNSTCLVSDLIHSLAAQLCQAPQLISYKEYLLSEPHLQGSLSQKECTVNPDLAFSRGIIEPLSILKETNRLPSSNMVILIDAVCEAEYHRPDRGDTIASFLTRHAPNIPSWLKIVCTVRTQLLDCAKQLPYTRISLNKTTNNAISNNINKDLSDYISYRLAQSPSIQLNVTGSVNGKAESSCSANQTRFSSHLLSLTKGSFLFAKLTLDLIESGHLVAKSATYKVLPVSLAQIFQLHFNLRFPTVASFDKVQSLLAVCLAALYPLTLSEIFYSINSLNIDHFITWDDFLQRFKMLSGFLVKRLDNTYMFFHPSFREWLIRRDEGESTKFLCDYRRGHAAIAFRLSRLEASLDGDKALELGHHVLKAHVYRGVAPCWPSRDLQAIWVTLSTQCLSSALCTLRNIYSPNVKVSRLLLLAGASPNHITEYLGSAPALCMYAHEGSVEMVSLLLEFGANVGLTNSQGCTALSLAAARGHCDVVRRLVAAGASLGHVDMADQCSLVHAAKNGRLSVVGYLLACDWVVSSSENKSENDALEIDREEATQQAVVAAASQSHEAIVEYLLDMAEVIVDRPDTLIGETALTISAANGSTATVSALLARGANPTAVNMKGLSPLMLAAKEGHWGTAERLLQGDLSISTDTVSDETMSLLEQRDLVGRTALMFAASEGHTNLLELFLDKGSILETKDKEGLTALSWACIRGSITAVQMLLDRGSDVNTNDNSGRTPLDLAAFQGNPKLVQLLLEKGAAVEHVDLHGMRPLDRAIGCRNISVIQCFLRRGAKLGPATWAMAAGKPDILIILLNKLLEDGNVLYRKNRLKEASHRYAYALRKFPVSPDEDCQGQEQSHMLLQLQTFTQLHLNFLLNLSRCKRKMNECTEAIELADEALSIRPISYEAFYARAKARVNLDMFKDALSDVQEALQNVPAHNKQDRRVLTALKDDIICRIDSTGTNKEQNNYVAKSCLRASVDTLTEL